MKHLSKLFLNGALVLIPLVITFYIVYWIIAGFESLFKNIIFLFPYHATFYFPGLGTLLGIAVIFMVGILMQNWGMVTLYKYGEKLIEKFPLMGDIYSSLKSLTQYFTSSNVDTEQQVVMLDHQGIKLLGIVTRENFTDCPEGLGGENMIAVFLPMSYQLGGYTVYLDKKQVTPVNMTKKVALQWILTAGLLQVKPAASPRKTI